MSRTLQVYIEDRTEEWLLHAGANTERSLEDLAESAVSESALEYAKKMGLVDPEIVDIRVL